MNCYDAVRTPLAVMNSYGCGARRRRLIACAALRPCWHRHAIEVCKAVSAAEAFADDQHDGNLEAAHEAIQSLISMRTFDALDLAAYATRRDGDMLWADLIDVLIQVWSPLNYRSLYMIIGDLRMPISVAERWHRLPGPGCNEFALSLAVAAYQNRADDGTLENDRLAVLADALEESGFNHRLTLEHLHAPGRHFQGCWALDWLLGKEK